MNYLLTDSELTDVLSQAEQALVTNDKLKFQRLKQWRKQTVPDYPGVYALYEKNDNKFVLLYIGETGNLRERMSDICRTVNHTFRKQLAHKRFKAIKTKKKFDDDTELLLNNFFDENLFVSFIRVNFGRTEIESHIVTKHQAILLNSETKRKLKIELDKLEHNNL